MTAQQIFDIATILWNNYSNAYNIREAVRNEVIDPKEMDGELFHAARLSAAEKSLEEAWNLHEAFKSDHNDTIRKALGI